MLFLSVFAFALVSVQIADCHVGARAHIEISGTKAASIGINKLIKTIINLPLNLTKIGIYLPSKGTDEIAKIVSYFINGTLGGTDNIIQWLEHITLNIADIAIELGILPAQAAENVTGTVITLITKFIQYFLDLIVNTDTTLVEFAKSIIKDLKLKEIIRSLVNAPFIRAAVKVITTPNSLVLASLRSRVKEIEEFIIKEIEEHHEFFQPILDGLSTRILILIDGLRGFITGNLKEYCKEANVENKSPTETLILLIKLWVNELKENVYRILGLVNWANEIHVDVHKEIHNNKIPPPLGKITLNHKTSGKHS